jgi:hypothetical protein
MFRSISFFVLSAMAMVASAAEPKAADPKAVVRDTVSFCPGGLERIIPGEYYFCAAVRDFGQGHNRLARERLRDAAHWASKPAQYVLGLMYFNGDEGPSNRPLGVAWLALASERHDQRFEPAFAKAYLELSPDERAQANVYWSTMKEEYSDSVAGARARRVYDSEMRNLQAASMFGGSVFIDGLTPPGLEEPTNAPPIFATQTAFSANHMISSSAEELFRGMNGTVTVGQPEMSLVPIGSVSKKVRTVDQ